jgi:hypothetical protein
MQLLEGGKRVGEAIRKCSELILGLVLELINPGKSPP